MRKRVKPPKKRGVATVPVVMQMETMECGAASLAMVLAYYGKWVPLSELRDICGVSRDGIKMSTIAKTARSFGLKATGYNYSPEELFAEATFPCIVHWNFSHFVVVCGKRGNNVYINDPGNGAIKITMDEFDEAYTGVCICMAPDDGFEPSGRQKTISYYVKDNMKGAGPTVAFVAIASFVVAFVGLALPGFSRVYIDRILNYKSPDWFVPFIILLLLLCIVMTVVSMVKAVYQMKLFGIMGVKSTNRYMWHLLHMPARFFSQRQVGALQQNAEETREIAETYINQLVPLVINMFMMIFYVIFMFRYNVNLALIGLLIVLINLLIIKYITNRRINIMRVIKRDMAKLMSSTMAGVSMIETIKASGAENAYFERWSGYQANLNSSWVRFDKISRILGSLPSTLVQLSSVIILSLGVYMVICGEFTVGIMFAFQGLMTAFMKPSMQTITASQMIQEMRTDMERIEDVMVYPEYDLLAKDDESKEYKKLKGVVELKNVSFGYSPLEAPIIKDFSLKLETGKSVAVVGASGCGKSTVLSLVSGLYEPWEGTITFDGKETREIPESEFRSSVAVIDQNITLFRDTVANNLRMWDGSVEDFELILAAKDAQIHDEILKRQGGYNYVMREGGTDFSGGQRQRLEIARALVTDPSIIILDEATSALDAATESKVVKSIKDRGITCIIVAHRLSTIRDCDEIIVLDNGLIAERGTHDELIKIQDGLYSKLVRNN